MAVTNTSAWASQKHFVCERHMWESGDGSCWPKYNHVPLFLFGGYPSMHRARPVPDWHVSLPPPPPVGGKPEWRRAGEAFTEKAQQRIQTLSRPQNTTTFNETKTQQLQLRGLGLCWGWGRC